MTLINATPHPITIVDKEGNIIKSIPVEIVIRLAVTTVDTDLVIDGIKVTSTIFGEPVGLPEMQKGIYYIVSQLVKSAVNRPDLLVPAEMQRDKAGNIIGCLSLGI